MKRILLTVLAFVLLASVAQAESINLITNGDFEAGNTGFTSPYTYVLPSDNDNQFYVLDTPCSWYFQFQCFGDHTTGTGQLFMGNGSVEGGLAYESNPFAVIAGSLYTIEGWFTSLGCSTCTVAYGNSAISLDIVVAGIAYELATGITDNARAGQWNPFEILLPWEAPVSAIAKLQIRTAPGQWSGNDFGIDDVKVLAQTPVPEPASMVLLGSGLLGVSVLARRRRRA